MTTALTIFACLIAWRIGRKTGYRRGEKSGSVAGNARAADFERMWCDARREIATLREWADEPPVKVKRFTWSEEAGRN